MILTPSDLARVATELRSLPTSEAYLFGSQARGAATADSDVDLAVVTSDEPEQPDFQSRLRRAVAIRRRLRAVLPGFPLDVLVYSPSEWRQLLTHQPILAGTIVTAGRRLI